jgi:dihydrodipicolinate synthase/N-acetylneuraminate lyase
MTLEQENAELRSRLEPTADNALKTLSNFVNIMGHDSKEFADLLMHEHRTLQQQIMELFLHCCHAWAKQQSWDPRNEHTIKLAKEIAELNFGQPRMPFV